MLKIPDVRAEVTDSVDGRGSFHRSGTENRTMNAQRHVEIVRRIYDAYSRGDLEFVINTLAPDVDWQLFIPDTIPYSGRFRGHAEVRKFFALFAEHARIDRFEVQEILESDNAVTVLGWDRVIVSSTERSFELNWAHVYNFRENLVVRFREYFDTAAMVKAFSPATPKAACAF